MVLFTSKNNQSDWKPENRKLINEPANSESIRAELGEHSN